MSSTIAIEIPREVVHAARMTPQDLRRELAICLYQQGRLSFGKAREMVGMTVWLFQQLLASREIPVHYVEFSSSFSNLEPEQLQHSLAKWASI